MSICEILDDWNDECVSNEELGEFMVEACENHYKIKDENFRLKKAFTALIQKWDGRVEKERNTWYNDCTSMEEFLKSQ